MRRKKREVSDQYLPDGQAESGEEGGVHTSVSPVVDVGVSHH